MALLHCNKASEVVVGFESFADFIGMGGHGLYVWLSYAIALGVIGINLIAPLHTKKQIFKEQSRRLRREQSQI